MTLDTFATKNAALQLVDFWQSPQGRQLPKRVLDHARLCLVDATGCGLFGSRQPPGQIMARVVIADESRGPCTLLGSSATIGPAQAALANGTATHGFELDDLIPKALIHPGTVIVPAVLAAGEAANASVEDVLRGLVAGYEAMTRLSLAIGTEPSHRGFHKTSVVGPVAAAIACGVVLRLSSEQIVHAAGLACSAASGIKAFTTGGGMVKGTHGGRSAEAGVRFALLAREGFTAPHTAIDGPYGLLQVFAGKSAEPSHLYRGLGEEWAMDAVWIKVFPVCGWIQGLMQILLEMRGSAPLALDRVRKLTVGTSAFAVKHNANRAPADTMEAQYSIPYCSAVGISGDPLDPTEFEAKAIRDASRRAFAETVVLEVDEQCESVFPQQFGTRVKLELASGAVREAATFAPHGTPADPCSTGEVIRKFHRLANSAAADRFANEVLNINAATAVRRITRILRDLDSLDR